jgi:hypothetical protein
MFFLSSNFAPHNRKSSEIKEAYLLIINDILRTVLVTSFFLSFLNEKYALAFQAEPDTARMITKKN